MTHPDGPTTLALQPGDRRVFVLAVNTSDTDLGHETHLSRFQGEALEASALPDLLGAPDLAVEAAEVFAVKDIATMGLMDYLRDAYDIPESALRPDRAKLAALDGDIVVLGAGALGRAARTLALPPALSLIGAYDPAQADMTPRPMAPTEDIGPATQNTSPAAPATLPRWLIWSFALKIVLIIVIIGLVMRL